MKTYSLLAVLLVAAAIAIAVAWRGSAPPSQRATANKPSGTNQTVYTVTGTVKSADAQSGIVRVAHDEIPGYMDAMTMPFLSRDPEGLRGLKSGDRIAFNLVVTHDDSWITGIQKLESASQSTFAEKAGATRSDREANRVQAGELVPELRLVSHEGKPFALSDFRGKAVLVNFIYTRCPLPNFCPLLSKKTAELEQRLSTEFTNGFHIVTITIDPEHDTPEVLRDYAARFTNDLENWTFATGSADQIKSAAEAFGLIYERKSGLIDHDLRTALISPEGRLVHIWKSNFWTPYEVRTRVEEALSGRG